MIAGMLSNATFWCQEQSAPTGRRCRGSRVRRNRCPAPGEPCPGQAASPAYGPRTRPTRHGGATPRRPPEWWCSGGPGAGRPRSLTRASLWMPLLPNRDDHQAPSPLALRPRAPTRVRGRAVLALVWSGTARGQRGSSPSVSEDRRVPVPTAAHVQPDHPAGRQPSGGRHLQRPAPGTSRRALAGRSTHRASHGQGRRVMDLCPCRVQRWCPHPRRSPLAQTPQRPGEARPVRTRRASALSRAGVDPRGS